MIAIRLSNGSFLDLGEYSMSMSALSPLFQTEVVPKLINYPFNIPNNGHNKTMLGFPGQLDSAASQQPQNVDVLLADQLWFYAVLRVSEISAGSIKISVEERSGGLPVEFGDTRIREQITGTYALSSQVKEVEIDYSSILFWDPTTQEVRAWVQGKYFSASASGTLSFNVIVLAGLINADADVTCTAASSGGSIMTLTAPQPGRAGDFDTTFTPEGCEVAVIGSLSGSGERAVYNEPWLAPHTADILTSLQDLADNPYPDRALVFFPHHNPGLFGEKNLAFAGVVNRYDEENEVFKANFIDLVTAVTNEHALVPMVYLWHVLQQLFALNNLKLSGDVFEDTELQSLVFYNQRALDWDELVRGTAEVLNDNINVYDSQVTYAQHIPDITVRDLLIGLRVNFNVGLFFSTITRELELVSARAVLGSATVRDLGPYLAQFPELTIDYPEGVTYQGTPDANDKFEQALAVTEKLIGNGLDKVISPFGTLSMAAVTLPPVAPTSWVPFMPTALHLGSSEEYELGSNPFTARLLFYRGKGVIDIDSNPWPLGQADATDGYATDTGSYSLHWDDGKGLYAIWWADWYRMLQQGRSATVLLLIPAAELRDVNGWFKTKWRIGATHVLIEQLSGKLSRGGISLIQATLRKL